MSSGWGWPRPVDLPASSPSPRRSTSVRSFGGATSVAEDDPSKMKPKKRATSLKSHSLSTARTGDIPAATIQSSDNYEELVVPEPLPEDPELVKIEEQPKGEPEALLAPQPPSSQEGTSPEGTSPLLVETPDHPQKIVSTTPELLSSLQKPFSQMSHDIDPMALPALPSSPIPEPSNASSTEKPKAKPISSQTMEDIVARVPGNTQVSDPEPTIDEPKTRTDLSHPFSEIDFSDSVSPKTEEVNQESLQSFPIFCDLPFEPSTVVHPEVPAPFDTARLPVPEIVIIRATDSVDDIVNNPDTSEPPDPFRFVPGSIEASLPGGLTQIEIPEFHLPEHNLILEELREAQVLGLNGELRVRRGHIFVRKLRKVFLRSPVLTVLLGRQLALLARPVLKIMASGGDAGVTALGPGLDMTEAAGAPLKPIAPVP